MPFSAIEDAIADIRAGRMVIVAENHTIVGGLGEAVASAVAESHPTIVRRVGMRDVFGESGHAAELMDLQFVALSAHDDQEEAVALFRRHRRVEDELRRRGVEVE